MRKSGMVVANTLFAALLMQAADTAVPTLNRPQLEKYLRYAEGFTADVHFKIDDPTASPFPGFYRVIVHLATDAGAKLDRAYYLTPDGQQLINGAVWDLRQSPFTESLNHMPTTGYSFGPADAKVKLVIFSDFQCPFCREFAKTVRINMVQKYPKDVQVVFEDFPIDALHPWARAASEAGHCIGDQNADKFWDFHDWIFDHQGEIKKDALRERILGYVKEQKLDADKITACMDSHADAAVVNKSLEIGKQLQVQQTPTVFVNGREVTGALPWASLDAVIQMELNKPASIPGAKAEECCQVTLPVVGKK